MKESFFTHDRKFYNSLFSMLAVVALQNVLAYSVNMADNIWVPTVRRPCRALLWSIRSFLLCSRQLLP